MLVPGVVEGEAIVRLVTASIATVTASLAEEERAAIAEERHCGVVLGEEGKEGGGADKGMRRGEKKRKRRGGKIKKRGR